MEREPSPPISKSPAIPPICFRDSPRLAPRYVRVWLRPVVVVVVVVRQPSTLSNNVEVDRVDVLLLLW
ncbi:hypothetical protein E2C01_063545 [Portunus trituberculatus]|uniref:Uncharacterized protein n=1 Tax=Portunus trituberculatus TaxID=210409 RepID=A0A5B7HGM9_PORTR|nr:hypothetical protein [Portunus trituberculatus]